jgi:hypothetical protein
MGSPATRAQIPMATPLSVISPAIPTFDLEAVTGKAVPGDRGPVIGNTCDRDIKAYLIHCWRV